MSSVTADDVVARFGLDEHAARTLHRIARRHPTGAVALPDHSALPGLLERLGLTGDAAAIALTQPDPWADPELWWLVEHCTRQLVAHVGSPERVPTWWPNLPAHEGDAARCVYLWVFLAAVDAVREYHAERGVPDDISWATLADLAAQLRRYRRWSGLLGLDEQFWLNLGYTGRLYRLGRLMFDRYPFGSFAEPAEGTPFSPGDATLGVHIPGESPLDPVACDASFAAAERFFATHFPEWPARRFVCASWLLDPQLREVLPGSSNIVRFQQRFTLSPDPGHVADDAVIYFVFGLRHVPPLEDLPCRTTLERAVVDHLGAGGHWHERVGWIER